MSTLLSQLFEEALEWLRENYRSHRFFAERDIVWTLQMNMLRKSGASTTNLKLYDNHKLAKAKQVDLAIIDGANAVDTIAEIKYEPDHRRLDIYPGKLNPSKVYWNSRRDGGVEPDIKRVREFVVQGLSHCGYAVFIDEGSYFSSKPAPEGSQWVDWGQSPYSNARISVLIAMF